MMLLVSLQFFAINLENNVLETQDEISCCIDIDVGISITVDAMSFEAADQTLSKADIILENNIIFRTTDIVNIDFYKALGIRYTDKIPWQDKKLKYIKKLDVKYGSSGGLSGRCHSLT